MPLHGADWKTEALKFSDVRTRDKLPAEIKSFKLSDVRTRDRLPASRIQCASVTRTGEALPTSAAHSNTQVLYMCWRRTRKTQVALQHVERLQASAQTRTNDRVLVSRTRAPCAPPKWRRAAYNAVAKRVRYTSVHHAVAEH